MDFRKTVYIGFSKRLYKHHLLALYLPIWRSADFVSIIFFRLLDLPFSVPVSSFILFLNLLHDKLIEQRQSALSSRPRSHEDKETDYLSVLTKQTARLV